MYRTALTTSGHASTRNRSGRICSLLGLGIILQGTVFTQLALVPASARAAEKRCVVLEIYVREGEQASTDAATQVAAISKTHTGLVIATRDISESAENRARFTRIAKHYGVSESVTPLVYACNRVISGYRNEAEFSTRLKEMLQIEVFVRHGCPRCARARAFLQEFSPRYGGLKVIYRDIVSDARARADMNRLVARHQTRAASVPVFHLCNRLIIGFSASSTESRLESALKSWTIPCTKPSQPKQTAASRVESFWPSRSRIEGSPFWWLLGTVCLLEAQPDADAHEPAEDDSLTNDFSLPLPEDPSDMNGDQELPLPSDEAIETLEASHAAESVNLPLFGELSANKVGLPALTVAVGLVDGFNPCAMWVLLFLLSLLVNLKDRRKILVIAGTFILVSGLAYFTFMAAWLNVFIFIGYLRPIQIALGMIAITIGLIHVKDFFAFHRGISLSIPEAAKPGIYARTRQIITAENVVGALAGATILALMVNIVELLCTAGLPALYTEILTMHKLPTWQNYAYLGLYNICYMFDDALMVGLVVVTLNKRKLQENQGRWLKLVSGAVIASLGAIMIVNPDLLI